MKPIKMLGLAVVAALAMMALFGAANAMAEETKQPELCKVKNETPCTNPYTYPLHIQAELQSNQAVLKAGEVEVTCQKSMVGGDAEGTQKTEHEVEIEPGVKKFIKQIKGQIPVEFEQEGVKHHGISWTECTEPLGQECTATPIQQPWKVHLNQKLPSEEQNNGDMYIGREEIEPGKFSEQPGAIIHCPKTLFGNVECTYKVKEKQPGEGQTAGEEETWAKLQVIGGDPTTVPPEPAKIIAKEVQLKRTAGGFPCGAEGKWNAEYHVTKPEEPMYVTHQAT